MADRTPETGPVDALKLVRRAIFDPGAFTERRERHGEELHIWQARAVLVALQAHTPGGITPEELNGWDQQATAATWALDSKSEHRDDVFSWLPGHIHRLATAYRELSASAAVQISTRQDRIVELEEALRAATDERDALAEQVRRARDAHPRETRQDRPVCGACLTAYEEPQEWPCTTIRALDGGGHRG